MKKIAVFFLLLPLFLGACAANTQVQQLEARGISRLTMIFGGALGLVLLLSIIVLVYYAEKRWSVLQLIRPSRWLNKLPQFREAKGLQRKINSGFQGVQRVKRYVPWLDNVQLPKMGSTSRSGGMAGRPESRGRNGIQSSQLGAKALPKPLQNAAKKLNKNKPNLVNDYANQETETTVSHPAPSNATPDEQPVIVYQKQGQANGSQLNTAAAPATVSILPETAVVEQSITPRIAMGDLPELKQIPLAQLETMSGTNLVGRQLARYRIDAVLEENEHSHVFQGTDLTLGRAVTLHQIRATAPKDGEQYISSHLQAVARLRHPAIARLQDCLDSDGSMLLVHEFVAGPKIDDYLSHMKTKSWQVSTSRTLSLLGQIAEGLDVAHHQDIIHGSLHPGRILVAPKKKRLPDGEIEEAYQAKLAGYWINRLSDVSSRPTYHWAYLSPEQLAGQAVDERSDIFSLGAILYLLATGEAPYKAVTFEEAQKQHISPPPLPTQLRPGLPQQIESIILKAMSLAPQDRYQTAHEMASELNHVASILLPTMDEEFDARLTKSAGKLYVYILCSGESPRIIELDKQTLHIGSTVDSEIYLPSKSVNGHHAKIERSLLGWAVSDLASKNGTFVDGARLLPQVAEEWTPGQAINVGPYNLIRLDDESMSNGRFVINGEEYHLNGADSDQAHQEPSAVLKLDPLYSEVRPGEMISVQLSLRNNSVQVDHFHLSVQGIPAAWLTISNNDIQLMPGDERSLLLSIVPPADHTATAGRYSFTVTSVPSANPTERIQAKAELMVASFEQITSSLDPNKHRNKGTSYLTLTNQGNIDSTITVFAEDPEALVTFTQLPPIVMLPPGEMVSLDLPVKGKRPLIGYRKAAPFTVEITTQTGTESTQNGQIDIRPYVPTWAVSVAGMLLMFLCFGSMFLANYRQNQEQLAQTNALATQAAIPAPTATIVWPTPIPTEAPMPSSCAAIKQQNPDAEDGEYTLYLGQDEARPVQIYCANMAAIPAEFITLNGNSEMSNYASVNFPNHELLTQFERIRIHIGTLLIDPTDRTFASTSGSVPTNGDQQVNDFGRALGCNEGQLGSATGHANIDLTGTGFVLSSAVEFVTEGKDIESSNAEILENGTIVNLSVSGRCGWIWPKNGLNLTYTGITDFTASSN
ncbi:MAG: GON domain-containing protein [Chloroflexota bacterium]